MKTLGTAHICYTTSLCTLDKNEYVAYDVQNHNIYFSLGTSLPQLRTLSDAETQLLLEEHYHCFMWTKGDMLVVSRKYAEKF